MGLCANDSSHKPTINETQATDNTAILYFCIFILLLEEYFIITIITQEYIEPNSDFRCVSVIIVVCSGVVFQAQSVVLHLLISHIL